MKPPPKGRPATMPDEQREPTQARVDRDDIVRLTEIRNDWQRKPSRYRDDANLLTRILAALTREAESVRAEATLAAIRAHAGTIWDAHDCKTAAVTYFDGEDAGRNHALTRDESSTEGGARLCRHDSTRVDGWLDDQWSYADPIRCLRCGLTPSEGPGERTTCPTCGHPREVVTSDEGTSYFKPPAQTEGPGEAQGLAARLNDYADRFEEGSGVLSGALEDDLREAATELARVHRSAGEQGAWVDAEDWDIVCQQAEAFNRHGTFYEPQFNETGWAALTRVITALDPAPITQPEEGE